MSSKLHSIFVESDGCVATIEVDGMRLRGITEITITYGVDKIPTVNLSIMSTNLVVYGCETLISFSEFLSEKVELAKKMMELSANNSIEQN